MKRASWCLAFFMMTIAVSGHAKTWTLALNWKAEPEFGGFYAALHDGFFRAEKLAVNIQEGGSGTPTVQMLAQGTVDFAIVSADEILLANDRDPKNPILPLFAVFQRSPYVLMTHSKKNYASLKDLFLDKSAFVSVQSGLPYFQFLIKKLGKPAGKVVPYTGGVSAFLNNPDLSQQGFVSIEPLLAQKSKAEVKTFLVADEGFNPYLVVLAVREKTWIENKEAVERFVTATKKGWQAYLLKPDKTNSKMAKLNKSLDPELFRLGAEAQKPLIDHLQLGSMTVLRWEELGKQLHDLGLIRSKLKSSELLKAVSP